MDTIQRPASGFGGNGRKTAYILAEYGALLLLSVLFLLFASTWTSPFYTRCYGDDASFYSMVGRGILHGYIPYRNFFDLKGPYLFFIQAAGQFLHTGRLGIFLIQIPFCFFAVLFTWKTALCLLNRKKAAVVLFFFLMAYTATLWGGNTAEEFSLPFTMLCLYLSIRYIQTRDVLKLSSYACAFGVSVGFMVFLKITLAASIGAMTLTVMILLIQDKAYKQLFECAGSFLFGLLIAAFPVFLYFGYYNAIPELIYQEFIFGFLRGTDYGETFNLTWELKMSALYVTFFFALLHRELDKPFRLLLLIVSAVAYLALHLGTPFIYYFTSTLPALVLGMTLFLRLYDPFRLKARLPFCATMLLFAVFIAYYTRESLGRVGDCVDVKSNPYYEEFYKQTKELGSLIPEMDRDSVYCLESGCVWFEINQLLPAYKYQINMPFFIRLDPSIESDLVFYFTYTPSKWLITSDFDNLDIPDSIKNLVYSKYDLVSFNDYHELYLLK